MVVLFYFSTQEKLVRDYGAAVFCLLETHLNEELWIQGKFEDGAPTHDELAGLTKWLLHFEALDAADHYY